MGPFALPVLLAVALVSQHKHDAHEHGRDRFRNPRDLERYIAHQEEPARAAWQKPDAVVKALGLRRGQTACDIGAGPGYFSLRLAKAVGPSGRVYAVDVDPRIVGVLRDRVEQAGARQVTPVLALGDDPLIPLGACDLILMVNVYHHFADGPAYLRRLAKSLAPGGRIVNIDFDKRETPVGPPMDHRLSREDFLAAARRAGLVVADEPKLLEHQYFIVMRPR